MSASWPRRRSWICGLAAISLLLIGLGLRLGVTQRYEPSIDWGVYVNWARRIAVAPEVGPVAEVARAAGRGDVGMIFSTLATEPDSLLFAVASGLYVYPTNLMRIGSVGTMAAWLWGTGYSNANAQLLAIVFDLLGAVLVYFLARGLGLSPAASWLAFGLLILLPAKIGLSIQAFYHLLGGVASLTCLVAYLRVARRDPRVGREADIRWGSWTGVGALFGTAMYFNWFLPQLALLAAIGHGLTLGWERRDLRTASRQMGVMASGAGLVVLPVLAFHALHFLALDWDPTTGMYAPQETNDGSLWLARASGYAATATEYFTLPLLAAAVLGMWQLIRDARYRAAAALLLIWLVVHASFFGFLTDFGARFIRAFQVVEVPLVLLTAFGLWTTAGWLTSRFAIGRRGWQRTALLVALAGLCAAPNLQRLPPLIREGNAIAARMPRFHTQYARGQRFAGLCTDLEGLVPAGSNVFVNAWQILEAVCPGAAHWQVVNLRGFCLPNDADSRARYLESRFPHYRPNALHVVILDRSWEATARDQEQCLEEVRRWTHSVELERGLEGDGELYSRVAFFRPTGRGARR